MKCFLILFLFIVPSLIFAQKGKSDFLLNKADQLFKSNPDSSFILCNQASELNINLSSIIKIGFRPLRNNELRITLLKIYRDKSRKGFEVNRCLSVG